jgi:phosphoglycolate phosphatase
MADWCLITTGALPPDVLGVLSHTRFLLLDFDGPVCDIFAGLAAHAVADRLKKIVGDAPATLPDEIADSPDPLRVFAFAAMTDPELGARVEAEMTELECAAVASARPTPYVHEVVTSCRESGRSAAVVSNNSERAVRDYLTRHGRSSSQAPTFSKRLSDPSALSRPKQRSSATPTPTFRLPGWLLFLRSATRTGLARRSLWPEQARPR